MKFVSLKPTIDPRRYLDELPRLQAELPPGAYEFANQPGHYDFYDSRCVKDLSFESLDLLNGPSLSAVIRLGPNPFKHSESLEIRYEGLLGCTLDVVEHDPVGPTRLGDLILDELLPHPAGCGHELAFHGGNIQLIASDLRSTWRPTLPTE